MVGEDFVIALNRRLVGHYNYYGVKSNERSVKRFFDEAVESAYKWLNRRGGKRNSFNWTSFVRALNTLGVAKPRVLKGSGSMLFTIRRGRLGAFVANASTTKEPVVRHSAAVIPHVRVCGGGVRQRAFLLRQVRKLSGR